MLDNIKIVYIPSIGPPRLSGFVIRSRVSQGRIRRLHRSNRTGVKHIWHSPRSYNNPWTHRLIYFHDLMPITQLEGHFMFVSIAKQ